MGFMAGLLLIAESQASEEGFLSKSDATKSSMNEYDKFIIASVNRGKHGNGPDALAHHNNPAEHGPAVEDLNTPIIAEREEKQAVQKMLADDSSSPFSVSAIGVALFSLVTMIGVGIRRKFQQGTVLASSSGSGPEMPINTTPALGDNVSDRREVMQALVGAVAGAVVMPQVAMADGAVSVATIQRARGIYGGRIAGLKDAVSKGDFAAVESEKNAFILFNSGAYRTNSPKAKAEKAATVAAYEDVLAAVSAKEQENSRPHMPHMSRQQTSTSTQSPSIRCLARATATTMIGRSKQIRVSSTNAERVVQARDHAWHRWRGPVSSSFFYIAQVGCLKSSFLASF